MSEQKMIFAGFGGQGILFIGKVIATAALIDGKNVTWLPSYGPEMRGGTANCSVNISDNEIGSPIITSPNSFIAMNAPSYNKFIGSLADDGVVIVDSSLVTDIAPNERINTFAIPATKLSNDNELSPLANMIMLGKLLKEVPFTSLETLVESIKSCVPKRFEHYSETNINAIKLGFNY